MDRAETYIKKIGSKWYAFAADEQKNQVYSIGADDPRYGSRWFARWTDDGIKYVASPSPSRSAAYKKASRHGKYRGEI